MVKSNKRFAGLLRSERGNVTIMVALALVTLVVVVGSAVDMARAQILQARISSALDSAGLSAAIMADTQPVQDEALKYFNLNFPAGYMQSNPVGVTATLSSDKTTVHLVATTNLQTSFMNVAGINTIPINVISDVKRGTGVCAIQNVYTADTAADIKIYDKNLVQTSEMGSGVLSSPFDVHVDGPTGNIWVTDHSNYRVVEFSGTGAVITTFGGKDTSWDGDSSHAQPSTPFAFAVPVSLTVDAAGRIYVTDHDEHHLQVYNSPTSFDYAAGTRGSGSGEFMYPSSVALDAANNLWVADAANGRYVKYSGVNQIQQIGSIGQYGGAWGVTVDIYGNVWGTSTDNTAIYKFSSAGTQLFTRGGFMNPIGITADGCGNIWVTDQDSSGVASRIYEFDNNGNQLQVTSVAGVPAGINVSLAGAGAAATIYIDQ